MLAELIYEYIEAKHHLEKSKAKCGYSRGHLLYDQIDRVKELAQEIEDDINHKAGK